MIIKIPTVNFCARYLWIEGHEIDDNDSLQLIANKFEKWYREQTEGDLRIGGDPISDAASDINGSD